MKNANREFFNIQTGNQLTWNVQPLLHEIRHALHSLLARGEASVIDVRSIPLAPGEEETLLATLGTGEVHATLEALGPSEIVETRFHGVWVTTHYNAENTIIGRFIEITWIPEILRAQRSDVADSLAMLETTLADEAKENHDRKREVTP